jgi:hypothetical protein
MMDVVMDVVMGQSEEREWEGYGGKIGSIGRICKHIKTQPGDHIAMAAELLILEDIHKKIIHLEGGKREGHRTHAKSNLKKEKTYLVRARTTTSLLSSQQRLQNFSWLALACLCNIRTLNSVLVGLKKAIRNTMKC